MFILQHDTSARIGRKKTGEKTPMWGKTTQIYQLRAEYQSSQNFFGRMIRFSNGDPGGVPSSLRSDSLAGVDTLSSVIAPRLLARVVTGGSLSQFPAAWHKAREEVINSSHWWLGVITDSQFKQFTDGTGVKTRGTGEGILFKQGEKGAGEFLRKGGLLRTSFSGDSTSFSPIWRSFLILCDKGGGFEGEVAESRRGRFLAACNPRFGSACRRWAQAEAAWRRDPFTGGGRVEDAASKAARWSTERR